MLRKRGTTDYGFFLKHAGLAALGASILVVAALTVASAAPPAAPPGAVVTKLASVLAESHANHKSYLFFADRVKELTGGKLIINVYPNSQLGNEREYVEFLQTGQIEFGRTATAVLGAFVPQFQAFDLPYLFKNKQQMFKAADGELGQILLKLLAEKLNIKGLGFFDDGTRCLYNSKRPVYLPADLKGMKVRTMESQIMIRTFNMLGAAATPLPYGELYSALQQGVVDAQENPIATIHVHKFYEVAKYISLTNHIYAPIPLSITDRRWQGFSPPDKAAFQKAASEVSVWHRKAVVDEENQMLDEMKAKGATVIKPDVPAFARASRPVYDKAAAEYPKADLKSLLKDTEAIKAKYPVK